ncbi:hypothetical protein BDFB_014590 [Asbolus verrucosus]|uniref:Uncharacterized protein n=1 Tax=Asbolus verrucosus TaxID=1661398 RepID=A0A482VSM3_ASBVE|nr:hypothetical protein BDFB_014590 [Asbolus verrucosus]
MATKNPLYPKNFTLAHMYSCDVKHHVKRWKHHTRDRSKFCNETKKY